MKPKVKKAFLCSGSNIVSEDNEKKKIKDLIQHNNECLTVVVYEVYD